MVGLFGVTWRTALTALFSAFGTAVTLRVIRPLIDFMNHPNHWLVSSLQVLADNMLLISVLSAMLMWYIGSLTGRAGAGAGQMKRITYGYTVTVGITIGSLLYFRFLKELFELATGEFAGPFTPAVELADVVAPVVFAMILAGTWLWVLVSPWQRERRRRAKQQVVGGGPQ